VSLHILGIIFDSLRVRLHCFILLVQVD
jgi:hypothetical protein